MKGVAGALGVVSACAFLTALFWRPDPDSRLAAVVFAAVQQLWLPVGLLAVSVLFYRNYVRKQLKNEIAELAGPTIVRSMRPRTVFETVLGSLFGKNDATDDVINGILGTDEKSIVSSRTELRMQLSALSPDFYRLTNTVTHRFRTNVDSRSYVTFVTSDPRLRDAISYVCNAPLFEMWYLPDAELSDHAVETMIKSADFGIDYRDSGGDLHVTELERPTTRDVKYQEWPRHLPFFRDSIGTFSRLRTRDFLSTLRIFETNLAGLAHEDHEIATIERLSVRQGVPLRIEEGSCYWQAPFPCYIDKVDLDVADLEYGDAEYKFTVMPFTFKASNAALPWLSAHELTSVELRSWLLPGHGVALLWRPAVADRPRGSGGV